MFSRNLAIYVRDMNNVKSEMEIYHFRVSYSFEQFYSIFLFIKIFGFWIIFYTSVM